MAERWFYRKSAEDAERGPVSKSDIQYLQSQGTIQPGMQIRSEFGEWSAVTSGRTAAANGATHTPASLPRTTKPMKEQTPKTAKVSPPAAPVTVPKAVVADDTTRKILAAAGGIAVLLLSILMLLQISGTGLGKNSGNDIADGNGGQQTSSDQATAADVGKPAFSAQGVSETKEKESVVGETADNGDGSSAGSSHSTPPPPPSGTSAVASGSQPAPLDRNVKQSHVLSPGAEFFGIRSAGRRFVFLIDSSASMQDGKDVAARRELVESVKRMSEDMELEVMFFTDTVTRAFGKFKSLHDKDEVINKINNANPLIGGTRVMPALKESIAMNPDAIFLLTDGVFLEGDICHQVNAINTNGISINTIAFVNRSAESVLKKVAADSGGDYRYVAN